MIRSVVVFTFVIQMFVLFACGTEETSKVPGFIGLNPSPVAMMTDDISANTVETDEEGENEEEPADPEVPAEPEANLLLNLSAAQANGGGAPYAPGCAAYQSVWANMAVPAVAGFLSGFSEQNCSSGNLGWKGAGTPSDPHRLLLSTGYANRFVKVNNNNVINPQAGLTWSLWIRPTAQIGYENILVKPFTGSGGGHEQYRIGRDASNGKLVFGLKLGGAMKYVYSNVAYSSFINKWTMIVATYDGSQMKIYINGALDSAMAATGLISVSTEPLGIGGHTQTDYLEFNGDIATVLLHDKALSAQTISATCQSSEAVLSGLACTP